MAVLATWVEGKEGTVIVSMDGLVFEEKPGEAIVARRVSTSN